MEGLELPSVSARRQGSLGVMLYYRPNPRHAGEFMDSMTAAVIDRMKP